MQQQLHESHDHDHCQASLNLDRKLQSLLSSVVPLRLRLAPLDLRLLYWGMTTNVSFIKEMTQIRWLLLSSLNQIQDSTFRLTVNCKMIFQMSFKITAIIQSYSCLVFV